jgi:hypothetical protein
MRKARRGWIEAGIVLGENPGARVRCPERDDAFLEVLDVDAPEAGRFDRYLRCPGCGARQVLVRMQRLRE